MELASFVGVPDWRSAVLAVAFGLPWLLLLARGRTRSPWLWGAVALAAALFPFSIAWVQVPLQNALGGLLRGLFGTETIRQYLLVMAIPSLLVASVVQESAKLAVAVLPLGLLRSWRGGAAGLAAGAGAGAGYGGFEAFWVFNQMFFVGWSWAMVDLGGPLALLGFIERFLTVPMHVGVTALAAYGYATGRPWRFWLLAVALHTAGNYAVVLGQAGLLTPVAMEAWVGVVAVAAIGWALWLRRRARSRGHVGRLT
jgi:hypothetical protein